MHDVTDILAVLLLVGATLRKLGFRALRAEDFPAVPPAEFARWRSAALFAYDLAAAASLAKIALNAAWFYGLRDRLADRPFRVGGALLFVAWVAALAVAGWLGARARRRQAALGIDPGRVPAEGRRGP